ncbi:metallophosphoesterase family protein [Cohnella fermenti]|uniref:Calcineurin-like phosphoesterase domain-containing protein n=1 Tax=Cohnella fermenti TaxID=2565925 RepID=A0A4S4BQE5_9BACL|nr:metallophosphoesterase [Cohnella fermenti]THF74812.1 hypothetical protein E6C55_23800 [Cohnella fermenti]
MKVEHLRANSDKQAVIRIEGLREPVSLLHVTDSHINETDISDGAEVLAQSYTEYSFDALDTRTRLNRTLSYANELAVDGVVLTGDIVNGATANNLLYLEERLGTLNAPYLYTLGNHDWEYPGEPWGESTRQKHYPKFGPLTGGTPGCQAKEIGGTLLLALDNSTYQITEEQLEWTLRELERGLPTLLFMHIPLYIPSLLGDVMSEWKSPIMMAAQGWDPECRRQWQVEPDAPSTTAFYRTLMDDPYHNVVGVFCGHIHFAHRDPFGRSACQYVAQAGFAGGYRVIRLLPL